MSRLQELRDRNARTPFLIPLALICAVEGIASLVFALVALTQINTGRLLVTITIEVTLLPYGIALALAARGVLYHRGWARGVAVFAQLLQLPIAWSFISGGSGAPLAFGVVLAVVSVVGLVCALWPSSTRAFADPNGPAGQH